MELHLSKIFKSKYKKIIRFVHPDKCPGNQYSIIMKCMNVMC